MRTQTGFVIEAPHDLGALDARGHDRRPGLGLARVDPSAELVAALQRAHRRGARIVSICTGAFVLAAAGLLDGRRATTHWLFVDDLQRRYPAVEVDPSVLYVVDGTIMTSAGTAAGIDLCLHIVTSDYGADVAAAVSRRMLMPLLPLGRAGAVRRHTGAAGARRRDDGAARVGGARISPPASRSTTSHDTPRSARARSRAASGRRRGSHPGEWLQGERLRLARRLLETSDDSIERVSQNAGYDTTVAMRAQFARRLHTSPRAYRRTFRAA